MKVAILGGGPGGLYLALLLKKADPRREITVYERNAADVTFGWGVVFSEATLENLKEADPESYEAIEESFVRWDAVEVHYKGEVQRSEGHGFCGVRRMTLLEILQERASHLGVDVRFEHEVSSLDPFGDCDLVVAADGVRSAVRDARPEIFRPDLDVRKAKYVWLGTTRVFSAFTFLIRENEHGLFQVHAYPFAKGLSTFIVETDPETWRAAGLDRASEKETVAYLEALFAGDLAGHHLLTNKSDWINFVTVRCERWHEGNLVLLGDAAHTAHFSIGSGTKMAMEDSICLARCLDEKGPTEEALAEYERERKWYVEKLQKAAQQSLEWFEEIKRYRDYEPARFAYALLTRSKRLHHAELWLRDEHYVTRINRWFAGKVEGVDVEHAPPPMFTPFRLRGLELENRVVCSPMCMYSADDGRVNDWHLVHLGSRAIGGAGLVMTEMTDVLREGRITPGCAGIYDAGHVAAWKRITDFVHRYSKAKIGMQIAHAGRKGATKLMWEGIDRPLETGAWPLISASPLPYYPDSQVPREMDRADMDVVTEAFAAAARRAEEAGFDLLELHMAHGYLLASFLSPLTNKRRDEYGGNLENRFRYPLEVFDAARAAWPEGKPMSVRISAFDWVEGGTTIEDSIAFARALKEHGCDIVDVSSGLTTPEAEPEYGRLFQLSFSERIRNEASVPTMTVGGITRHGEINTILVTGAADLCVLAKRHLYEPYFTLHAAAEQEYFDQYWPPQYGPAEPRPREKLPWLERAKSHR